MADEKKEMGKKGAEFRNDVMFLMIFLILAMQLVCFILVMMAQDEPKKVRAAIEDAKYVVIRKDKMNHAREMIAIEQGHDKIIEKVLTEVMTELRKKKEKE
jgi:hypothetical protein